MGTAIRWTPGWICTLLSSLGLTTTGRAPFLFCCLSRLYMMAPHGRLPHPPGLSFPSRTRAHFSTDNGPTFPHLTDTVLKDHRQKRPSQPHPDTPLTPTTSSVSQTVVSPAGPRRPASNEERTYGDTSSASQTTPLNWWRRSLMSSYPSLTNVCGSGYRSAPLPTSGTRIRRHLTQHQSTVQPSPLAVGGGVCLWASRGCVPGNSRRRRVVRWRSACAGSVISPPPMGKRPNLRWP